MTTIHLIRGDGGIVYFEAGGWKDGWPFVGRIWWFRYCVVIGRDGA